MSVGVSAAGAAARVPARPDPGQKGCRWTAAGAAHLCRATGSDQDNGLSIGSWQGCEHRFSDAAVLTPAPAPPMPALLIPPCFLIVAAAVQSRPRPAASPACVRSGYTRTAGGREVAFNLPPHLRHWAAAGGSPDRLRAVMVRADSTDCCRAHQHPAAAPRPRRPPPAPLPARAAPRPRPSGPGPPAPALRPLGLIHADFGAVAGQRSAPKSPWITWRWLGSVGRHRQSRSGLRPGSGAQS